MSRFHVTPKESRRRFRESKWSKEIDPEEYVVRTVQLARRWLQADEGVKRMEDKIIVEHLVDSLPHGMKVWMADH